MFCLAAMRLSSRASVTLARVSLLALFVSFASAHAEPRDDFLAAERALADGDTAAYSTLRDGLRDYPLYPYLRFAELSRDLDRAQDDALAAFLAEFPDTPQAERVRSDYLKRLARDGRWSDYIRGYRPDDSAERRCLYLRALLAEGRAREALDTNALESLWLVGRTQPPACEPLFDAWAAAGGLSNERVWARIRLALDASETDLAKRLGEKLPTLSKDL